MSIIQFAKLAIIPPSFIKTELVNYTRHWQPHFNKAHYRGGWEVLPLRSPGGKESIVPDLMAESGYADTISMQHFPSVSRLVQSLQCPIMSVRFLNLKAGAYIKPHRDYELAFEKGEARLHFPILTNPDVVFCVEGTSITMQEDECWYINANLSHQVSNRGQSDRIHLVIDCQVNDWLRKLFDCANKQVKEEKSNTEEKKQVIAALRLQNTTTAIQLANQLEKEL